MLAGPPPFQLRPPMTASTVVAFGGLTGRTYVVRARLVAIHAPRKAGRMALHSVIGPVTWYQVYPSATRGPPTIATRAPARISAILGPVESGVPRTVRRTAATEPKPPTASF